MGINFSSMNSTPAAPTAAPAPVEATPVAAPTAPAPPPPDGLRPDNRYTARQSARPVFSSAGPPAAADPSDHGR